MLLPLALVLATLAPAPPRDTAWAASLRPGKTVTLPAGRYRGPWKLGTGVHLIALPGASLEGGNPVLTIAGDAVIVEGLTVRAAADAVGVATVDARSALLRHLHVIGGVRGISVKRGSVELRDSVVEQSSKFGVWLQGVQAIVAHVEVRHIGATALYLGHANGLVSGLTLDDAENGMLAYLSRVELSASGFSRLRRIGASFTLSSGSIEGCTLEGPFSEAALSIVAGKPIALRQNRIRQAGSMGIKLLNSHATLVENDISQTKSDDGGLEGDGIFASGTTLDSTGDRLTDNAGVAISVSGGGATIKGCSIENAGQAAIAASSGSEVVVSQCSISGGSTQLITGSGATLREDTPDR